MAALSCVLRATRYAFSLEKDPVIELFEFLNGVTNKDLTTCEPEDEREVELVKE